MASSIQHVSCDEFSRKCAIRSEDAMCMQQRRIVFQIVLALSSLLLFLVFALAESDLAHVQLLATAGPYFAVSAFKTCIKP